MNKTIHKKLTEVTRLQATISYSELALFVDLDMSLVPDRNEMSRILGEISTHEHDQKHPMLSAVVTHKDGDPGKGFYKLARDLGVMPQGADKIEFWSQELRRVYDFWQIHAQ